MAAYIVKPGRDDWKVISRFLADCREGAIVIPPDVDEAVRRDGVDIGAGELVEYDFGGEPNILIDVADNPSHYAFEVIHDHLVRKSRA